MPVSARSTNRNPYALLETEVLGDHRFEINLPAADEVAAIKSVLSQVGQKGSTMILGHQWILGIEIRFDSCLGVATLRTKLRGQNLRTKWSNSEYSPRMAEGYWIRALNIFRIS